MPDIGKGGFNLPVPSFIPRIFDPANGAGYTPNAVPIQQPFDTGIAQGANAQNQAILQQQQAFVNAMNQYGGAANQQNVFMQQQGLASQLNREAGGQGPNPALAQLQQTTAQNAQMQGAMMGSQRGVGANPALLARHISDQMGQINQQAAGQAATLSAQQQLAAQGQLQSQLAGMGQLAGTQVGQQQGALQNLGNMGLGNSGQIYGTIAAGNNANVNMQGNINQVGGGIAQGNQAAQTGVASGIGQGFAQAIPVVGPMIANKMNFASGGVVNKAMGGDVAGPISDLGQYLNSPMPSGILDNPYVDQNHKAMSGIKMGEFKSIPKSGELAGAGDNLSSVENIAYKGGQIKNVGSKLKSGGGVPGKANVSGDSLKNDTVNARLSPGEIVIPRSVINSRDPVRGAAEFVAAVLAHKGRK